MVQGVYSQVQVQFYLHQIIKKGEKMSDKIKPIPQPESDRYWEGANEKKLLIQK